MGQSCDMRPSGRVRRVRMWRLATTSGGFSSVARLSHGAEFISRGAPSVSGSAGTRQEQEILRSGLRACAHRLADRLPMCTTHSVTACGRAVSGQPESGAARHGQNLGWASRPCARSGSGGRLRLPFAPVWASACRVVWPAGRGNGQGPGHRAARRAASGQRAATLGSGRVCRGCKSRCVPLRLCLGCLSAVGNEAQEG